jgi:two-component system chemotaxis response regulator CheB
LQPDLIVLDVSMPLMNGLEAVRAIRGVLLAVPLMMYSSFAKEFA